MTQEGQENKCDSVITIDGKEYPIVVKAIFGYTKSDKLAAEVYWNGIIANQPDIQSAINECCKNIMKDFFERIKAIANKEKN